MYFKSTEIARPKNRTIRCDYCLRQTRANAKDLTPVMERRLTRFDQIDGHLSVAWLVSLVVALASRRP